MGQKIILSVIIVTYRSDEFIFDAIRSVNKYNDLCADSLEIIVVDNSPSDYSKNSFELLRREFPQENLILIPNFYNGGYGQGNNLGIQTSKGKYICIMNPDVNLVKPVYMKVLKNFQKHNVAMVGGKQYGNKDLSFYIKPEYEFFILTTFVSDLCNKMNLYSNKWMYLSGALLFIDKCKFEQIGSFDEKIFLYCEEPDLTHRFSKQNYQCVFDREIEYRHLIDDRTSVSDQSLKTLICATQYYLEKFNFSFSRFINQKLLSYRIIKNIYRLLNKPEKVSKTEHDIKIYKEFLS